MFHLKVDYIIWEERSVSLRTKQAWDIYWSSAISYISMILMSINKIKWLIIGIHYSDTYFIKFHSLSLSEGTLSQGNGLFPVRTVIPDLIDGEFQLQISNFPGNDFIFH